MKKIALIALLIAFVGASCTTLGIGHKTVDPSQKKAVIGVEGIMTMHPIKILLPTKDPQYCFFDFGKKVIFMTEKEEVYTTIAAWLPETEHVGHAVSWNGPIIDPFVSLSKDQFRELSKQVKKMGLDLNEFKVARLFNYSLKSDNTPVNQSLRQ